MAYNTVIIFVAYAVLPAASLNNNDANLDFLKTQVDTTMNNGRLTLETAVAVSTTDQTAKTTLYWTPFKGNRIGLKSGSSWDLYTTTEKSLSLASHIKGVLYDIYGYLSAGVLTLESLAWKKVTASNSPTAGSSKAINISDTGDLAVGREVSIKDGTNSEITTVISLVANTSITVDLVSSYTTPDVYGFNTRATALTLDDGKWVKSGDATRRYLGTIRITSTTGQCEDSAARRYVWNLDNQVERRVLCVDTTNSWTPPVTLGPPNSSTAYGVARIGVVVGLAERAFLLDSTGTMYLAAGGGNLVQAIGVNSVVTNSAQVWAGFILTYGQVHAKLDFMPTSPGFYYFQRLELDGTTSFGDNAGGLQSGMRGLVMM